MGTSSGGVCTVFLDGLLHSICDRLGGEKRIEGENKPSPLSSLNQSGMIARLA